VVDDQVVAINPRGTIAEDAKIVDVAAESRAVAIDVIRTDWLPRCRAEYARITAETARVRREIPLSDAKWRKAIKSTIEKLCVETWGADVDDDVLADALFPDGDRHVARERVKKIRQRLA
jgi:hypothetical protein